MKFEDAVKKSVKSFMAGKMPTATSELIEGGIFYTPEYFDELAEELVDETPKTKKSKAKETADADV